MGAATPPGLKWFPSNTGVTLWFSTPTIQIFPVLLLCSVHDNTSCRAQKIKPSISCYPNPEPSSPSGDAEFDSFIKHCKLSSILFLQKTRVVAQNLISNQIHPWCKSTDVSEVTAGIVWPAMLWDLAGVKD